MTLFRNLRDGELASCEPGTRLHRQRTASKDWAPADPTAPGSVVGDVEHAPAYEDAVKVTLDGKALAKAIRPKDD